MIYLLQFLAYAVLGMAVSVIMVFAVFMIICLVIGEKRRRKR